MRHLLQQLFVWILSRPLIVICIIAAVTFLFGWRLPDLAFKTSIYDLQIEDLPETAQYDSFKKIFGSDEIIRVVIKSENIFDPVTFHKVEQLAQAAAGIEGVRRVISLPGVKKAVDVSGNWDMEKFSSLVAPVELFHKNLISDDRKTTALTLVLKNDADPDKVIAGVRKQLADAPKDLMLYQIGMPLVSEALVKFTEKDFSRLPPLTFLLIAVILLFLFRKVQYVLLPLVAMGLALVWTLGLMTWLGIPLSMLTMIVPVFLIAVGTAYCLHILSEYLKCRQGAPSAVEAVTRTYSNITLPTCLAVLTTAVGLGSLVVNRISAIQEFAVFSCFGIFSILVIVMTFLPAALSLIPHSVKDSQKETAANPLFDRFIEKVVDLNLNHQRIVLPVIGVLVLICLIGIFRMRVETNPVGYLKDGTTVKNNFNDIYRNLSGSFPINVAMGHTDGDYFEDPEHLADIARVQDFLVKLPGVDKTVSFADYLKLVNYVINQFQPKYYILPDRQLVTAGCDDHSKAGHLPVQIF